MRVAPSLLARDTLRQHPFLHDAHLIGAHILYRLDVAETDALRIAVTEVTLEDLSIDDIEAHGAERNTATQDRQPMHLS